LTLRWLHLTDDELLLLLKSLLEKEGRLNEKVMDSTLGVPSIKVYFERFGSLRNAYRAGPGNLDRTISGISA
jgi:hypothetical protein